MIDTWRHVFLAFRMSNFATCLSLSSAGDLWMNFKLPKYSDSVSELLVNTAVSPSLHKVYMDKYCLCKVLQRVDYLFHILILLICEITPLICSRVIHSSLLINEQSHNHGSLMTVLICPLISWGTKQWGCFLIAICLTSSLGWQADDSGRRHRGLHNSGQKSMPTSLPPPKNSFYKYIT